MRTLRFVKLLSLVLLLGLLTTVASAQGTIPLPEKPKDNVMHWRSGIVEETLFFTPQEDFRPAASQPLGHNILVNQDFNFRAQNETSIFIDPNDPQHIVTGYNDYRPGWPIGAGSPHPSTAARPGTTVWRPSQPWSPSRASSSRPLAPVTRPL